MSMSQGELPGIGESTGSGITRRSFIRYGLLVGTGILAPGLLSACGESTTTNVEPSQSTTPENTPKPEDSLEHKKLVGALDGMSIKEFNERPPAERVLWVRDYTLRAEQACAGFTRGVFEDPGGNGLTTEPLFDFSPCFNPHTKQTIPVTIDASYNLYNAYIVNGVDLNKGVDPIKNRDRTVQEKLISGMLYDKGNNLRSATGELYPEWDYKEHYGIIVSNLNNARPDGYLDMWYWRTVVGESQDSQAFNIETGLPVPIRSFPVEMYSLTRESFGGKIIEQAHKGTWQNTFALANFPGSEIFPSWNQWQMVNTQRIQ